MHQDWEKPAYMERAERLLVLDEGKISELPGTAIGVDTDTGIACCPKKSLGLNENRAICGGEPHGRCQSEMSCEIYAAVQNGESFVLNVNTSSIISRTELDRLIQMCKSMNYRVAEFDLRNPAFSNSIDNFKTVLPNLSDMTAKITFGQPNVSSYLEKKGALFAVVSICAAFTKMNQMAFVNSYGADVLLKYLHDKKGMDELIAKLKDNHPAKKFYQKLEKVDEKEWEALTMETIKDLFNMYMEKMSDTVSENIDLSVPAKEKCAYFIYTGKSAMQFPAAAVYTSALYQLKQYKEEIAGKRFPVKVRFLLYDFGSIGEIPDIEERIWEAREDVSFTISYRSMQELCNIFGDREWAEKFLRLFDTNIFMGNDELDTTIQYYAKNASPAKEKPETVNLMERIFGLGYEDNLVLLKGQKPMKLSRYNLFQIESDIREMKQNIRNHH